MNDVRLSDMGPDGNSQYDAALPAVAAVPGTYLYIVVWEGDDNTFPLVNEEKEIFYQPFDSRVPLYLPVVIK